MLIDTTRFHRICTVLGRLGIEYTFRSGYYTSSLTYRYDVLPFPAERAGIQFPNGGSHCRAGNWVGRVSSVIRAGYGSMGIHQGLPVIPQYDDIVGSTAYHVVGLPVKGSLRGSAYRLVKVTRVIDVAEADLVLRHLMGVRVVYKMGVIVSYLDCVDSAVDGKKLRLTQRRVVDCIFVTPLTGTSLRFEESPPRSRRLVILIQVRPISSDYDYVIVVWYSKGVHVVERVGLLGRHEVIICRER